MEIAADNSQRSFRWGTSVSKTTCNKNEQHVHGRHQGLNHWTECLKESVWLRADVVTMASITMILWETSLNPPTEEVEWNIRY